jgi:hypothetical protein
MQKAFAIACSTLLALVVANLGNAVAADLPYYKAPPPVVGKGKAPIGKGKGKAPVVVTRAY